MTEKVQINPLITAETREALRRTCQERGLAQGDIVELALLAFLAPPGEEGKLDRVLEKLTTIETAFVALCDALTPQEEEKPQKPPVAPIATYEQMYGPIDAAPAIAPETPAAAGRPKGLRGWFV